MAGPNFTLPYPPVLIQQDTLQTVKVLVPVGFLTVVPVFTTAQNTVGKFFVDTVVVHDPTAANGAVGSTQITIGSASTSTTSMIPPTNLTALSGSVANQYIQLDPGLSGYVSYQGVTTTATLTSVPTAPVAYGPGDVINIYVTTTAATSTCTVLVDIIGYYL